MAGDVAALGLSVDSSDVVAATRDLSNLSNASEKAERAAAGLTGAVNAGARAMGLYVDKAGRVRNAVGQFATAADIAEASAMGLGDALRSQAAAAAQAAGAMGRAAAAANDNGLKAGAHNVSNIAAQFQDVAVTAAGGMNAFQIGLQQGTQLAMVIGSMEKPLQGLGAAFLSVLSPLSLLVIGLTSLAAAGIQLINWSKVGAAALRGIAAVLPVIAPYAAAAAAGLALLYAPAIVNGLASLAMGLASVTKAGALMAVTFAAANPAVAFVAGFAVAATAAVVFRNELTKILGVDIVGAAKTGVNYIIGAFVAAYGDIKFLWSNFGDIIGAAVEGAVNAAIDGINKLIKGFASGIDAIIGIANKIPGVNIGAIGDSAPQLANVDVGYRDRLSRAAAGRGAQQQQELNADYLGSIGGAIASGSSAAAAKLREMADELLKVEDKSKKGGKTEAEKYANILANADRRIASLQAEAAALGLTEEAAARLRYETELLNAADQAGITLSSAQRAELSAKAATMAQVETAAKRVKEGMDFAKDGTNGFLSDLRQGLQNGEGLWKSFGNAALNVLNKIADRAQNVLVDALFSLGGSGGGGSGLFGSIFSGLGKLLGFASGGYTGNGAASAVAGVVHGGEFVFSKRATDRIGVGNLSAMHTAAKKGYAEGGYVAPTMPSLPSRPMAANSNLAVQVGVSVDDDGKIKAYVKSAGEQAAAAGAAAGAQIAIKQTPGVALKAVGEQGRRRG